MAELIASAVAGPAFVALFTGEAVAPASRNHCDRRWLLLASVVG